MWIITPLTCVSAILIKKYIKTKLDIPAFLYALYISVFAHYIYFLCRETFLPNKICVCNNVEHIYWVFIGSGLYELYNGIICMHYGYILHSIIILFGSVYVLCYNFFYYPFIFTLIETSTIFLNLLVYKNTVLKVLFVFTFLFYRWIVLIPYFIYIIDKMPSSMLICGFIFNGLNIYWGTKIISKLHNAFNNKKIE